MTDLPIRVLSIPHSGTRFVKEWLKDSPEMNEFFSWLGYDDLPWMVED